MAASFFCRESISTKHACRPTDSSTLHPLERTGHAMHPSPCGWPATTQTDHGRDLPESLHASGIVLVKANMSMLALAALRVLPLQGISNNKLTLGRRKRESRSRQNLYILLYLMTPPPSRPTLPVEAAEHHPTTQLGLPILAVSAPCSSCPSPNAFNHRLLQSNCCGGTTLHLPDC